MGIADDKKYLAALQAERLAIITGGVSGYAVPGRSVTKLSLSEINSEIAKIESRMAQMSGGGVTYANLRASSSEGEE